MVGVGVGMGVAVDAGMVEGDVVEKAVGGRCCVCTKGVPGSGWIRDVAVNSRFCDREKSRISGV